MSVATRRLGGVVLLAGMTAALTGCADSVEQPDVAPMAQVAAEGQPAQNGIDDKSPADALADSIAAMEAAGTYKVNGVTSAGSTIDIGFQVGVGSVGTVTSGSAVTLVSNAGAVYVTGDTAALTTLVGADVATTIAGKWLLVAPDSMTGFAIFADGTTFANAVLGSQGPGEMTSVKEVDGVPAVGLTFPETGGTLWVSATGEPLPLRFEEKGASAGTGVLTFSGFGTEVVVPALPAEDIVDLTAAPAS